MSPIKVAIFSTTLSMVSNVTYTSYKGPNLDAYMSQNVTHANCRYDSIRQHK